MTEAQQVLKKVKKLEIKTKNLVDGLMQGAYHSVFKGRGIEFSEVREYQVGDDIRTIDWNVTARMNHPFVKEFIEERDLTVIIIFDISGSSEFGTHLALKKEIGIEISASLAFSALRNNDKVGLLLSTSKVEKYIPPRKGKRHVLRLIRDMIYFEPDEKKTDLGKALGYISKIIKKRSIIFVISDFMDDEIEALDKCIKILKNRHDVIAVSIQDRREFEMPDVGLIELEDEETGEQILVNTSDEVFRRNYSELVGKRKRKLKKFMSKQKVDLIDVSTSEEWAKSMMRFFRMRERRRAR